MTRSKEQRKEYYLKNKEYIDNASREYYSKNKERLLKIKAVYRAENKEKITLGNNRHKNSERGYINETICAIFTRSRKNNNKNNKRKKWIPECTKQDIYDELMLYIQDHGRNCEYCKEPWTHSRPSVGIRGNGYKKRGSTIDTNFSIDRLDSEKTYTVDNLVFCCIGCNNRKNQVRLSDIVNITRVWIRRRVK